MNVDYYKKELLNLQRRRGDLLAQAMVEFYKELTGRSLKDYDREKLEELFQFVD